MLTRYVLCVLLFVACGVCGCGTEMLWNSAGGSGAAATLRPEIVGVCVTKPDPENQFGGSSVMGRQPGTSIHLRIRDENRNFIAIRKDSSVHLRVNGDVLPIPESTSFGFMSNISDDGHTCTIPVHSESLPPAMASSLLVEGTIGLVAARDATTIEHTFKLKKGSQLTLGDIPVKVSDLDEPWNKEYAIQVQFQGQQPFDAIQKVEFLDENDQLIESASAGRSNISFNDNHTYSISYSLKRQPSRITARVTYYQVTEDIDVPVHLETGLGIGGNPGQRSE